MDEVKILKLYRRKFKHLRNQVRHIKLPYKNRFFLEQKLDRHIRFIEDELGISKKPISIKDIIRSNIDSIALGDNDE